jgi:hypothetical protein
VSGADRAPAYGQRRAVQLPDPQQVQAGNAANDINNRIHGPDLVKMNFIDRYTVHGSLGGSQTFENSAASLLDRRGESALPNQLLDFRQMALPGGGLIEDNPHVGAGQPVAGDLFRFQAVTGQFQAGKQLLQLRQLQAAIEQGTQDHIAADPAKAVKISHFVSTNGAAQSAPPPSPPERLISAAM